MKQKNNISIDYLIRIENKIDFIYQYIKERKKVNIKTDDALIINNQELADIIEVSISTLQRWRRTNKLISHIRNDKTVYYFFDDIIKFLKSDIPSNRRFNKIEAIKRLRMYERGIMNSQNI